MSVRRTCATTAPGLRAREGGFGGGEVGGEWSVVEDVGYPAGKVMAGAVVAQDALVAAGELGFQFGEVGGDGPGGGAGLGAELEPVGGLHAGLVVFVLVAQVGRRPGPIVKATGWRGRCRQASTARPDGPSRSRAMSARGMPATAAVRSTNALSRPGEPSASTASRAARASADSSPGCQVMSR